MCWYGHSLFLCLLVFFSWSRTPIDDQFLPTRPTGKHLSIPTLLFSFERSNCYLSFLCYPLFLVYLCFYFRTLLHALWCITCLTNMLMHKNAFMPRNTCMHKWAFAGTHEHICVLRSTKDKKKKFWIQHLLKCRVYIYIYIYIFFFFSLLFFFFFFLGPSSFFSF